MQGIRELLHEKTKIQFGVPKQFTEEHKFQSMDTSFQFLEWYTGVDEDFMSTLRHLRDEDWFHDLEASDIIDLTKIKFKVWHLVKKSLVGFIAQNLFSISLSHSNGPFAYCSVAT